MKTCSKCKSTKVLDAFPREMKRGKLVHRAQCTECRHTSMKAYRHRRYDNKRAELALLKAVPCADCAACFPAYVMDFDHRDPEQKIAEIGVVLVTSSWRAVLEEVAKCDVVCANCHRLRTWGSQPAVTGKKRALLRDLKSKPCLDCGGEFHPCQMDFDHTRGQKTSEVSRLTGQSLHTLLNEVAKCDVVCANCHRERTHARKGGTVGPSNQTHLDSRSLPEWATTGDWRSVVGTMEDQAVAAIAGISRQDVYAYRKENRIPRYTTQNRVAWQHLVGTMTDTEVAKLGGVTKSAVGHYRRRIRMSAFVVERP